MDRPYVLSEIDIPAATGPQIDALAGLIRTLDADRVPEDPPTPIPSIVDRLRNRPEGARRDWIVIRERVVAHASVSWLNTPGRRSDRDVSVEVDPDYRRRGIGRALLGRVLASLEVDPDLELNAKTIDRVPAGAEFARWLGARPALANIGMELELRSIDRHLLMAWSSIDPAGYDLLWIDGPTPDRHSKLVIEAYQSMLDSAPRGDLHVEPVVVTRELLRALPWGDTAIRAGRQRRMLLAVHLGTGSTAAFTEVSYDPRIPHVVSQAGTGTAFEHRGHDLAKWLKASMLLRIRSDWPDARIIRTGNAVSNAPMLSVNERLGFKPVWSVVNWQMSVADARRRLAEEVTRSGHA